MKLLHLKNYGIKVTNHKEKIANYFIEKWLK
jgi:hypothetical protein